MKVCNQAKATTVFALPRIALTPRQKKTPLHFAFSRALFGLSEHIMDIYCLCVSFPKLWRARYMN
jgi:hypothetical protein